MKIAQRALTHPLVILVIGGVLSGLIGPYVSKAWQDHAEELSVKSELVQRINIASASLIAAVQAHEFHSKKLPKTQFVLDFRTWDTDAQAIDGKIATYFRGRKNAELRAEWREFCDHMLDYYNLGGLWGPRLRDRRLTALHSLSAYANSSPTVRDGLATRPSPPNGNVEYNDSWRELKGDLVDKRNEMVADLLEADLSL